LLGQDYNGWTVLMKASANGQVEIVEWLLGFSVRKKIDDKVSSKKFKKQKKVLISCDLVSGSSSMTSMYVACFTM
jgi:hypothetical protein